MLTATAGTQWATETEHADGLQYSLTTRVSQAASRRRRGTRRMRSDGHLSEGRDSELETLRADLHDGPAQYLAYALMHLDALEPAGSPENDPRREAYRHVRTALAAALEETRAIASGASLPSIRRLDPASVIAQAVRSHEVHTHTSVERQISQLPRSLAQAAKLCLYRFTQEGLNNAYRHARGKGQKLTVKMAGNDIVAEVVDEGSGDGSSGADDGDRLGLKGLRQRAEAVGGRLELMFEPGKGTRLMLRLPAQGPDDSQMPRGSDE